jgi:hypothetical protein
MDEQESDKRVIKGWEDFFEAVAAMRLAQQAYFKTKSPSVMFVSKDLERLIDNTIAEHRRRVKGGEP